MPNIQQSTPGYTPKRHENKILTQLVVNVYKALITKAKRWKHRCPVIDEWMNKM